MDILPNLALTALTDSVSTKAATGTGERFTSMMDQMIVDAARRQDEQRRAQSIADQKLATTRAADRRQHMQPADRRRQDERAAPPPPQRALSTIEERSNRHPQAEPRITDRNDPATSTRKADQPDRGSFPLTGAMDTGTDTLLAFPLPGNGAEQAITGPTDPDVTEQPVDDQQDAGTSTMTDQNQPPVIADNTTPLSSGTPIPALGAAASGPLANTAERSELAADTGEIDGVTGISPSGGTAKPLADETAAVDGQDQARARKGADLALDTPGAKPNDNGSAPDLALTADSSTPSLSEDESAGPSGQQAQEADAGGKDAATVKARGIDRLTPKDIGADQLERPVTLGTDQAAMASADSADGDGIDLSPVARQPHPDTADLSPATGQNNQDSSAALNSTAAGREKVAVQPPADAARAAAPPAAAATPSAVGTPAVDTADVSQAAADSTANLSRPDHDMLADGAQTGTRPDDVGRETSFRREISDRDSTRTDSSNTGNSQSGEDNESSGKNSRDDNSYKGAEQAEVAAARAERSSAERAELFKAQGAAPPPPTHDLAGRAFGDAAPLSPTMGGFDLGQGQMGSIDGAASLAHLRASRGSAAPLGVPQQLMVNIRRQVAEGNDQFTINLRPAELGRIDIKLEFGNDGRVTAQVMVEKAQTLELLMRDSRNLERTLQDAGLKTDQDSLSFSLRDEGGQAEAREDRASGNGRSRRSGAGGQDEGDVAGPDAYQLTLGPGRVDIHA